MDFFVYVLENKNGKLYIGQTQDLNKRIKEHNPTDEDADLSKFTHKHRPWKLIGSEKFPTRSQAMSREKQLKSWKDPKRVRKLFI
jgi:predicted GIY-YIG superfamily endonuclease